MRLAGYVAEAAFWLIMVAQTWGLAIIAIAALVAVVAGVAYRRRGPTASTSDHLAWPRDLSPE